MRALVYVFPYLQRDIYFQDSLKAKPPLKLFIVLFFFEAAQLSCSKTPVPSRKTENAEMLENAEEFHSCVLFPQQRQYLSGVRIKTGPFGECQQDSTRPFKPQYSGGGDGEGVVVVVEIYE